MRLRPLLVGGALCFCAWACGGQIVRAAAGGGAPGSSPVRISLPVDGGSLRWTASGGGSAPRLAGWDATAEPGDPDLPARDVLVLLPPDTRPIEVTVTARDTRAVRWAGPLAVAAPARLETGEPAAAEVVWDRIPAAQARYPAAWGELTGLVAWHGYRCAAVRLHPLRVARDPETGAWIGGELAGVLDVAVKVAADDPAPRRLRAVSGESRRVREQLAARVANPDLLAAYAAAAEAPRAKSGAFAPTYAPSLVGSDVDLVIVTGAALAAEFQRLADYKTARGIPAVVRTVEEIAAGYPTGADLPEKIRAFLRDAYERWGTRYVLLAGDITVIPARKILNGLYPPGEGTEMPVDLYYAGVDGNWNADGDEIMGEPYRNAYDPGDYADLAAEFWLGRLPATTAGEAAVLIDKIIDYERDGIGTQYGRMLFLSEVLFPSAYAPGEEILDDGASYSEAIIDEVLAQAPAAPLPVRLYEATPLWPGSFPETYAAAVESLNSGAYGLVNHVGHGFFYNMSVGDRTLELKDAAALRNDPSYFVLNSLNCSSSAFDYNSILERFLLNPDGGAVATVGSARAAFPVLAGQYQKQFYRELMLEGVASLGAAVAASRAPFDANTGTETPERWTHMTYTLLGDPTLLVWTASPLPLAVSVADTLPLGAQIVTVQVTTNGQPLPGATVCLLKADEDYAYAVTDAAGEVALPLTVKSGGVVELHVTAPNHQPYAAALPVSTAPASYLKVTDLVCRDDGTGGTFGNGDGVPNPGETVAFVCTVRNTGSLPTGTTALHAWTSDPGLELLLADATIGALAPGAQAVGGATFVARISPAVADASDWTLGIVGVDGPRYYVDELAGTVSAPSLEPNELVWSDYPSGDGDGTLEANENIAVSFTLFNLGGGRASGLTGTLQTDDPNVVIVDGAGAWPDAAPLAQVAASDPFVVRVATLNNDTKATLTLRDGFGHVWTHRFDLKAPAQAAITGLSAPAGGEVLLRWSQNADADLLGYHVFRSSVPNGGFTRLTLQPLVGGTFFRDSGLQPMTRYYYQVAAVDSSRLLGRNSITGSVSTVPSEGAGYPIDVPVETSSHPAVGDVNGDGVLDVVLAANYLYVWDAGGVELRDGDGDPQTLGPFNNLSGDWGPAGVALANLTAMPGLEIVASYRTGKKIYVYQGDGSVAPGWPQTMSNWNWATPAVGDIDGNGDLEIVVNTIDGRLYVWNHDGTEFRDGDGNPATVGVFQLRAGETYSFSSPTLADLDGDGGAEIIFGTRYRDTSTVDYMHALRHDGTQPPGWPVPLTVYGEVACSAAVGDIDQDGSPEVVFVSENDRLHVLRPNGAEMSPFPISFVSNCSPYGVSCPSPALADFDHDGKLEIVAVSVTNPTTASIRVITTAGADLAGWPRPVAGNSESSPVVADITGDGELDVLFGIGGGSDSTPNYLYAFRHNGGAVPGFPLVLSGPIRPAPFLTDLDGDGGIDIVYGGWDLQMHVWDLPSAYLPARAPWPTFKGNPLRTGVLGQAWVTAVGGWTVTAADVGGAVALTIAGDGQAVEAGPWRVERCGAGQPSALLLAAAGGGAAAAPAGDAAAPPAEAPEGVWEELGLAVPLDDGRWVYRDESARPGQAYRYRARSLGTGRLVASGLVAVTPGRATLAPNWPNPCNPRTRLAFALPAGPERRVRLTLYDVRGRRVRGLVDRDLGPGRYEVDWRGDDDQGQSVASGVYLYRLEAGPDVAQRKLLLLR